ncbi:hypothetical protein BH11GEM2_BH11GEM2_35190 [soil metagenome]
MDWFVKAFLKASLAWLVAGVTIGVAMGIHPLWTLYRVAHMHIVLLGFVAMMIFGVAYHVIPRFTGYPLHSRRGAMGHWWASNVGLLLMVAGFVGVANAAAWGTPLVATGGGLSAFGAYIFAYLMWRTIDGPAPMRAAAKRARDIAMGAQAGDRRPLPTAVPK